MQCVLYNLKNTSKKSATEMLLWFYRVTALPNMLYDSGVWVLKWNRSQTYPDGWDEFFAFDGGYTSWDGKRDDVSKEWNI